MSAMIDELKNTCGVNVDEALERFMGNTMLYEMTLKKFPAAVEKYAVEEYIQSGDFQTAEEHAHAMKGTTGNLSFPTLFDAYVEILQDIRSMEITDAERKLKKILPMQSSIVEVIEKYM